MKVEYQKGNNKNNYSSDNRSFEKDISNIKLNRMEDDIKNIINEKDEIINNMNDKILRLEKIIKDQSERNEKLFQILNSINEFNDKLKRSNYFDIEISGTDKELNDLNWIGLSLEILNGNNFDEYFKTESQLEPNIIIFSIRQKKNDKIPTNELVSNLVSKLVSEFIPPESPLYEKFKDKGIQFKIRENNKDCIFIDFYADKKFLYDLYIFTSDNKAKVSTDDKDNENQKDKAIDKEQKEDDDIFKTISNKLKISSIFDKSEFNFYFKMLLRTDFLFKYLFEEDIEKIIKDRLNFSIIANSDMNTKILLLSIISEFIEDAKKEENLKMKDLLSLIKILISIPLKKIKYDLIEKNKEDIYDLIRKLYKKFEQNIQDLKNLYNSKDCIKELIKDCKNNNIREIMDLFYKIIDFNELSFGFGYSNNKLGLQINTHLPEDNKIIFLFILFLIFGLIFILIVFIGEIGKEI